MLLLTLFDLHIHLVSVSFVYVSCFLVLYAFNVVVVSCLFSRLIYTFICSLSVICFIYNFASQFCYVFYVKSRLVSCLVYVLVVCAVFPESLVGLL